MIGDTEANKRNKFEWTLNIIRLEKIISAPMLAPKFFLEVSALEAVRHCPKLQSWAISGKTNDGILRKKQNAVSKIFHEQMGELDNEFNKLSKTGKMSFTLHTVLVIDFLVTMMIKIYMCQHKIMKKYHPCH